MRAFARSHAITLLVAALTSAQWAAIGGAQAPAEAQPSVLAVRVGDTVRVWSKIPRFRGAVASVSGLTADTLNLNVQRAARLVAGNATIAIPSLSRLDVQDGRSRSASRIVGSVVLGLVLGAAVGAGIGPFAECGGSCSGKGEMAGFGGFVAGAGVGAVVGAVGFGALGSRKQRHWRRVALVERER